MTQILLISRRLADRLPPLFNRLENAMLHPRRPHRWPLGKPSYQLIEKLLGADLEVEGVSAVLDTNIEQLYFRGSLSYVPRVVYSDLINLPPAQVTIHSDSWS